MSKSCLIILPEESDSPEILKQSSWFSQLQCGFLFLPSTWSDLGDWGLRDEDILVDNFSNVLRMWEEF